MNGNERLKYWEDLWGIGYVKFVPDLFEYAKEQADRVQELEEVVKHNFRNHKHQQEMIFNLEQQNKRYREALNIIRNVTEDAIHDIDSGMKVQGLEYIVKVSDNLLGESE